MHSHRRHRRRKILFLCTANSARSVLAEHLLRQLAPERFEVHSAGSNPAGSVHPMALRVLDELYGIDASSARSKSIDEVQRIPFDLVVTVCDGARDACPAWLGPGLQAHWGLRDPAAVEGSEEDRFDAFRRTAILLQRRLQRLASLPPEKLVPAELEAVHRAASAESSP